MLKCIWVLIFTAITNIIVAQCPEAEAGDDQFECSTPATFFLDGDVDGDVVCYYWTPEDDLSDPFSLSPEATISEPTTYYLVSKGIDYSINLVENGDFSGGDSGFYTDYQLNDSPAMFGNPLDEGQYNVGNDPEPMHINWEDCGDHTSGSGDMLIANGAEVAGLQVWCQDIAVDPDTDYAFSAWVVSVDPNGPVEIQFSIDGSQLGAGNVGLSSTCDWVNFFEIWNSGSSSSITICIEDVNTEEMGNDFAIDDITFSPLCETIDSVTLTPSIFEPEIFYNTPICAGEDLVMYLEGADSYEWDGPDNFSSFDSEVTLFTVTTDMSGIYYVDVFNDVGCGAFLEANVEIIPSDYIETISETCDPNQVGTMMETLINEEGCDSTVVTTFTLLSPSIETVFNNSCDIADVGTEVLNLTNQLGCDSTVTIITSFVESDSIFISELTCDSGATGVFVQSLINMNGCDSIVETTITSFAGDTTFVMNQTCDVANIGMFLDTFQSQLGCDSVVQTSVMLFPPDSIFVVNNTCDPNLVGINSVVLQNQNGCDSIVTIETALQSIDTTFSFQTTCYINLIGTNTMTEVSSDGCDSIVVTEIEFVSSDSIYFIEQTCDSTLVGFNVEVFQNQYGCDSIIEYETQFIAEETTFQMETTCDINSEGVFLDTLQNEHGCDSIVNLTLTYVDADSTFISQTTCDLEAVGVSQDMFVSLSGCDSIVTTEIVYVEVDSTFITNMSCDAADIGIFEDLQQNAMGCDSLIINEVLLSDESNTDVFLETCDVDSVGVFIENLSNQFGCDSIVTTSINLVLQDTSYLFFESCDTFDVGITTENFSNQFGCDSLVVTEVVYFSDLDMTIQVAQPDCFDNNMGSFEINASGGTPSYLYAINGDPYQPDFTFVNLDAGTYELRVRDESGCEASDVVVINSIQTVSVDLGDDFSVTVGESAEIVALVNVPYDSLTSIQWFPIENIDCDTCLTQLVYPIITTSYTIEVVNSFECAARDTVSISVAVDQDFYVPNVFSLDGQAFNDKVLIFAKEGNIENINSFQGYDRWGEKVWEYNNFLPNDPSFGWDGRYQNTKVNPGVFVWLADITFVDGTDAIFAGSVTVLE